MRCEHKEPTARLIAHLAALGHRRIGMVLGMDGLSATVERVRSYRAGLRAAGLPEDGELIADGGARAGHAGEGDGFAAGARRNADRAGERQQLHAIGILRALEARGLRVPDDLALVALRSTLRVRGPVAAAADLPAGARRRVAAVTPGAAVAAARSERVAATLAHRDSCGCTGHGAITPSHRARRKRVVNSAAARTRALTRPASTAAAWTSESVLENAPCGARARRLSSTV